MDFVIAGIVIGGLLVACGVFVRDFGPRLLAGSLRRTRDDVPDPKNDPAWKRYCIAIGSLITGGGLLVVLITVLGIVLDVSDSVGDRMVIVASLLAAASVALAIFVVTPHYRRGGFEPKPMAAEPVTTVSRSSTPVRPALGDDLFAPEPVPTAPAAVMPPNPVVAAEDVTETSGPAEVQASDDDPAPDVAVSTDRYEHGEPVLDNAHENGLPQEEATSAERPVAQPEVVTTPVVAPVAASQRLYEQARSQPAVPTPDPPSHFFEDDELPAWNAPVPTPEPQPAAEPSRPVVVSVPVRPALPTTPGGFQSSILADLTESPEEPQDLTGTFKSRLLNELTRVPSAPVEPTVDVLLDEVSVPLDHPTDNRNSGSGR